MIDVHSHCRYSGSGREVWTASVTEEDWDLPGMRFFGIHPWFAAGEDACFLRLEERLRQQPLAGVGEIGLDRIKGPEPGRQEAVLRRQLELALRYDRPVCLHCVRRWGSMLTILQDFNGLRGFFHDFSGSPEMGEQLLRQGWFLSFSPRIWTRSGFGGKRLGEFLRRMSLESLLLETDAQPGDSDPEKTLENHYRRTAALRGIGVDILYKEVKWNAAFLENGAPRR